MIVPPPSPLSPSLLSRVADAARSQDKQQLTAAHDSFGYADLDAKARLMVFKLLRRSIKQTTDKTLRGPAYDALESVFPVSYSAVKDFASRRQPTARAPKPPHMPAEEAVAAAVTCTPPVAKLPTVWTRLRCMDGYMEAPTATLAKSDYFAALLDSEASSGRDGDGAIMVDMEAETMRNLLHWLSHGTLPDLPATQKTKLLVQASYKCFSDLELALLSLPRTPHWSDHNLRKEEANITASFKQEYGKNFYFIAQFRFLSAWMALMRPELCQAEPNEKMTLVVHLGHDLPYGRVKQDTDLFSPTGSVMLSEQARQRTFVESFTDLGLVQIVLGIESYFRRLGAAVLSCRMVRDSNTIELTIMP